MCSEAEEREKGKGWNLDDILQEVKNMKEAESRMRAVSVGWMEVFSKRKSPLDNNVSTENNQVDCFLCKAKLNMKGFDYKKTS